MALEISPEASVKRPPEASVKLPPEAMYCVKCKQKTESTDII